MTTFSDQIRENIKRTRMANGITPEQMATHLNISPRAYAEFETGNTKLDLERLSQIAERFEMGLLDLLSAHERKTVNNLNNHRDGQCVVANNNVYLLDREVYEQHIHDLRSSTEYLKEENSALTRELQESRKGCSLAKDEVAALQYKLLQFESLLIATAT